MTEFVRFLLMGGAAAVVNLVARYGLNVVIPFELAVLLAYGIGMGTAWILTRLFVFAPSADHPSWEFARFTLVNAASAAVVWGASVTMLRIVMPAIRWEWYAAELAHLVGVASPVVLAYFAHKHFTFRSTTLRIR